MGKFTTVEKHGYIYVLYTHDRARFQTSTGFKVSDPKNPIPNLRPRDPMFGIKQAKINEIMQDMFTANSRLRTANVYPDVHAMRREYYKVAGIEPEETTEDGKKKYRPFWDMLSEMIASKGAMRCKTTINNYNQFKEALKEFCDCDEYDMEFKTFDNVQFGRYIQYLIIKKEFADSTINKHVRLLNGIFKWSYPDLSRNAFTFEWRKVHNIHPLYEGELRCLIESDEVPPGLELTRDLFVFCCCTGMRYSDSQNFKDYWVDNGLISFNQIKTGGEAITPLVNAAHRILVKYGGTTPKLSNVNYNLYVKDLLSHLKINRAVEVYDAQSHSRTLVPFCEQVTTHTARKTFVTLALERGIPVQDVMLMSGHHDFRAMRPYIKIARDHLREEGKKLDW